MDLYENVFMYPSTMNNEYTPFDGVDEKQLKQEQDTCEMGKYV